MLVTLQLQLQILSQEIQTCENQVTLSVDPRL